MDVRRHSRDMAISTAVLFLKHAQGLFEVSLAIPYTTEILKYNLKNSQILAYSFASSSKKLYGLQIYSVFKRLVTRASLFVCILCGLV